MIKCCKICQQNFEITEDDLKFYDKISPVFNGTKYKIPSPTLGPECRQQRRLSFRNERNLYHRKCDFSGKQIISNFSEDKPYIVYDQIEWWSDKWDGLNYGQNFDFNKSFFEQFNNLNKKVPHCSIANKNVENSYYSNFTLNVKNCYLVFGGGDDEDCLFSDFITNCRNCTDCSFLNDCELCYEGICSNNCYNCKFFINSKNCTDCIFIQNCTNCKNCIGCFNLNNKEYYIFNEYVGKERFNECKKDINTLNKNFIENLKIKLNEQKYKNVYRYANIFNSENCTGDMIDNSKNCTNSFDIKNCEDSKNISFTPKTNNTYDCDFASPYGIESSLELCSSAGASYSLSTFLCWNSANCFYSIECHNSSNLFGCVGLKHKKYCILNKQYTKEDYEILVPKIIEHMQKNGEWGEFFPISLSPFTYNETVAQEYFPLSREEACLFPAGGLKWKDEEKSSDYQGPIYQIPDNIRDVNDEILQAILKCEVTGKLYKIIPQELKFYRDMNLPIPRRCPDLRHKDRMALRNPRKLFDRKCMKCNAGIKTTYAPDRPEIVYCEKCYLESVY